MKYLLILYMYSFMLGLQKFKKIVTYIVQEIFYFFVNITMY
jgi:hypothetical protein